MIEYLFEFSLSFVDYTYLLYFYLLFIGFKWNWKKALPSIFLISLIQLGKETMLDFGGFSMPVDIVLVIGFLFLYCKPYTIQKLLCALMLDAVFKFSIIFYVSLAMELSIDVNSTLIFGYNRFLFSFVMKIFNILILMKSIKYLKELRDIMSSKMLNIMIFITSFILFGLSYVYGNTSDDESLLIFTIFLTIIMFFVYSLFYQYCVLVKKENDYLLMDTMMTLTSTHVEELEKEHEQIREIRHDYKNQMLVVSELLKDEKYEEIKEMIFSMAQNLEMKKISISGNTYIDAVLRQKIAQYSDIEFKLEITITSTFHFDGKDIVSLLTNIIDNACEELYRVQETSFQLLIMGNENQLRIVEKNISHKDNNLITTKDSKRHGYGLKIIEEIVRKYEGDLKISIDEYFTLKLFITL